MKKQILLLCTILCMTLTSKAYYAVVSGNGSPINCSSGDPFWPGGSNNVCCCLISCSNSAGEQVIALLSCVNYVGAFAQVPPKFVSTPYAIDAEISFQNNTSPSPAQIDQYRVFKENGSYNLNRDVISVDSDGNTIHLRAGNYQLQGGKLLCNVILKG